MPRKMKGLLLPLVLLFPAALPAQEPTRTELPRELTRVAYGVRPGDEVEMRVFTAEGEQLREVSGIRIVDPSGQIYLPYLGPLTVEGMSAPEIRELMAEQYARFYATPVVEVTSRLKVNVTGAVRGPGHYLLDPSSTIIDALAAAGGVGSEIDLGYGAASDPESSRLVRNGKLYILDLRPNSGDPGIFSLPIQSGDWLHIPIADRSRVREQVQFWGGVISLAASTIALFVLIGG